MWPYVWIALMLGLVIATTVIAMKEKKAREKALKAMQPKPLDGGVDPGLDPMAADDGLGDGFGEAAELDGDAFK